MMTPAASDDDHPAKRLGRKLREARMAAGYRSQEEFSARLPLHRTTVTKMEGGTRHITPEILRKWCELCLAIHIHGALGGGFSIEGESGDASVPESDREAVRELVRCNLSLQPEIAERGLVLSQF